MVHNGARSIRRAIDAFLALDFKQFEKKGDKVIQRRQRSRSQRRQRVEFDEVGGGGEEF